MTLMSIKLVSNYMYVHTSTITHVIVLHSKWRYYRDNSGNCTFNDDYGPESECSTGYVKYSFMSFCSIWLMCIVHTTWLVVCTTNTIYLYHLYL